MSETKIIRLALPRIGVSFGEQIHGCHYRGDHEPPLAEIMPHTSEPILGLSRKVTATRAQHIHQYRHLFRHSSRQALDAEDLNTLEMG